MSIIKGKLVTRLVLIVGAALGLFGVAWATTEGNIDPAGNISPDDKWAWSTNAGWINFNPTCGGCQGVTVYRDHLEGYAWGENVGWIRMGTHTGGGAHTYLNTTAGNYGVNRDAAGTLSGYAWGTTLGWINFAPAHGGVAIDPATGSFDGYAWAENAGWIHFRNASPAYNVVGPVFYDYEVYLPLVARNGP